MVQIEGFSKKSKQEKLEAITKFFKSPEKTMETFKSFDHREAAVQEVINEFSENTISNFHLPYSIAPNFLINGKTFAVPMVIEESSVVAAASNSAKFWYSLGGFHTEIVDTEKVGQVHFLWHDDIEKLTNRFDELKQIFLNGSEDITVNMRNRGGGIKDIILKDLSDKEPGLMQLFVTFETIDSMGANFVNSCLERFAGLFRSWHQNQPDFKKDGLEIIMSILSNLTPNCVVKCWVETDVKNLDGIVSGISGKEFAKKFHTAVRIAQVDPYRATTHNKGIYNGVDAVVLATGNDFRAVEACGHAYASINGSYSSLTNCTIENDIFRFELTLPIALGVVGGLTNLHPLVKLSHELLDFPNARELMGIAAAAGLANNFGAVKSLTTTGIQQGHMKMHLFNIMNQLEVKKEDRDNVVAYFKDKNVSVSAVRTYVESLQLA
ncbi:hydroxymethylglutaryl-CoA reductase, degradative [Fluviicola taffensis]|uniref:3-hydroxy-3-methylglutaryl coenzyme A reductase n=1 Tax=Fluviicola taffensis (strain DSM 16823 / NCIMB 13979 / RW262) TaxID=755732 RepID=F2I9L1_FLUTR|nr:hydroxymethylglutaryl-CoA reductase, degradative [Fluviicola taffensis]AEA45192.1 hydroxymethylglutaryl-CoA reductase, degradative [Fluviicola taffensis DSM 16823]